jgi:hypothetical protein
MKDEEIAKRVSEMRIRAWNVIVSMTKDSNLDDGQIRRAILRAHEDQIRFVDDSMEDE